MPHGYPPTLADDDDRAFVAMQQSPQASPLPLARPSPTLTMCPGFEALDRDEPERPSPGCRCRPGRRCARVAASAARPPRPHGQPAPGHRSGHRRAACVPSDGAACADDANADCAGADDANTDDAVAADARPAAEPRRRRRQPGRRPQGPARAVDVEARGTEPRCSGLCPVCCSCQAC